MEKETAAAITERLEQCFVDVQTDRMDGIPILNQSISVRAIGMRKWQDHWLCVLLTPWFMNLMLLPSETDKDETSTEPVRVGTKKSFAFPAGQFEFIRGDEPAIGAYWMCSLFSPVLEFSDQATAQAAAEAALEAILGEAEEVSEKDQEMAMIWQGDLPEPEAEPTDKIASDAAEAAGANNGLQEAPNLSRRAFLSGKTKEASS